MTHAKSKKLPRASFLAAALLTAALGCAAGAGARRSPEWLRGGVIYEVNPRTFSSTGDFRGVAAGLPALKALGVNIVWLMPIHPLGRDRRKGTVGSPYAVRDYYAVNPGYGTKDGLHSLVKEAHRLGLKIIIDIVANHTAWDSVMMRTPAFYKHDASGKIIWPEDWTDVAALNYDNPALRRYMTGMLSYWIRDFDLDGFRCDVAGAVPVTFWNEARAALDKIKPDIIMLAEAHAPDLLVKAFDLDYSWPLHSKLTQVFEEGAPASELIKEWTEEKRIYSTGALHMRFSDNHDEKRAIARFGERGALAASAFVFTLDGVPLLYNGMEAGDTTESGAPALFEKLPVFWKIAERRPEFPRFYRQIIALRRAHPALQQGELHWIANSDPDRILSYIRRDADEELLVAINTSNRPFRGTIEGLETGDWSDIAPPLVDGSHPEAAPRPTLPLTAWGYRILRRAARSRSIDER